MPEDKEIEIPKESLDDTKKITIIDQWYDTADAAQSSWETQARESLDFVCGRQWDSKALAILEKQGRPALTFNELLPLVNLISGYERQNRTDIKPFPRKGGAQEVANILYAILKDIFYISEGDFEVSYAYTMGFITGKAFLDIDFNTADDLINGQLMVNNISPFDVKYDPFGTRYDLDDRDYLFHSQWMNKNKIEQMFPKAKKAMGDFQVSEKDKQLIAGTQDAANIEAWRYRLKRCYWREYIQKNIIVNVESGEVYNTDLSEGKVKKIVEAAPNLRHIARTVPVLNLTTKVGNVILEEIKDPFKGIWRFPIVPFFAYFFNNEIFGMIDSLKDPQREMNKRYSQTLHHLNMTANSGLMYEEGSIVNESELNNLGMKPGVQIKTRKGAGYKPEILQPGALSQGHIELMQLSSNFIKSISGVSPNMQGMPTEKNESGLAREKLIRQGLIILEPLYDNFRRTKRILGKRLIDIIQHSDVYSQEEVLNLMVNGKVQMVGINQEQVDPITGAVKKVLNDLSVGKYDVVIDESPQSPTARMVGFASMLEALKMGLPIPPDQIVEASDWANKEEIKKGMDTMQKMQALAKENEALKQQIQGMGQALDKVKEHIQGEVIKGAQKIDEQNAKMQEEMMGQK